MILWKNWCKNRVCITKLQKLFFSGTEYISSENKLHGSGLFLEHYFLIRLLTIGWKQRMEKRYMVLETMWFEETSSNEIVVIFNSGLNRECFPRSVQSLSHLQLFVIPWTAACQASLSITNSQSLLKLMSIASVMPSNHLIFCCPFSSCLQSLPASGSFLMSPFFISGGQSIGISALAPLLPMKGQDWFPLTWTDWLTLLALQGTLKSLLQHHSLKASILQRSAFFIVQRSHLYMTTGKTIALTQFSSLQSLSCVRLFATPWTAARQASLSINYSRSSPKPMLIESVMPSNHLILCCPLLLPSIFPSIRVFSSESALRIR